MELSEKRAFSGLRRVTAVLGAAATLAIGVATGCSSSTLSAPELYHLQNQNSRREFLPDETVKGLQACVDATAADLQDGVGRVEASVRLNEDGQVLSVELEGVPEGAPDLASCSRIVLREMSVPSLPLRSDESPGEMARAAPAGNEMANPIVLAEAAIVLAEFMAQHGGRAILYAVTLEVVAATTVAGVHELRKRRKKDKCAIYYDECVMSSYWRKIGRHDWDSLCSLCAGECYAKNGNWPARVGVNDCNYQGN